MVLSRSTQPRKQRLAAANAPLHLLRKSLAAHLAGGLIERYNRRSLPLVVGDRVKVLRGSFRGHTDKVVDVDSGRRRIVVEGVTVLKADGTKKPRPIDPSNVEIVNLNLSDPRRREKLASGIKATGADKEKVLAELEEEGQKDRADAKEASERAAEEREKAKAEAEKAEEGDVHAETEPEPEHAKPASKTERADSVAAETRKKKEGA